ncbi:hypothetical protein [Nonomuraea sp. GTA35]|uniref:hypothetical protein n=1 Tax=Nonomuraea sp. GTA35 TaxID=1676746 RepID=UPI0035BFF8B7
MPPGQPGPARVRTIEDLRLPAEEDSRSDLLGLAAVVLRERKIPFLALQLIRLQLGFGHPGLPQSLGLLEIGGTGGVVATVAVSKDGGLYYVFVPSSQAEPYQVPADQPESISALIPGYGDRP